MLEVKVVIRREGDFREQDRVVKVERAYSDAVTAEQIKADMVEVALEGVCRRN